jgi:hypothetical protein
MSEGRRRGAELVRELDRASRRHCEDLRIQVRAGLNDRNKVYLVPGLDPKCLVVHFYEG